MILVYQTTNNTREIKNPNKWERERLVGLPHVAVDPDKTTVRGVKRHYIKVVNGQLVEMSQAEKDVIDESHRKHGVDNRIPELTPEIAPVAGAPKERAVPATPRWKRLLKQLLA